MFLTLAETLGLSAPYMVVAIAAIVGLLVADLATSRKHSPTAAGANTTGPTRANAARSNASRADGRSK